MWEGEPMALGVSNVFPKARFLHAMELRDGTPPYINTASSILLVRKTNCICRRCCASQRVC